MFISIRRLKQILEGDNVFLLWVLVCFVLAFFFPFTMSKTPGLKVLNGFLMDGIVTLIKPGSVNT